MSNERLIDMIRGDDPRKARPLASTRRFAFLGALGGIALAVLAIIVSIAESHRTYPRSQGALLLASGALFGLMVGLDLYSTRAWRRLGKYTLPVRFILACSAGGTVTGLVAVLLGVVTRADLWRYTSGGAILGLVLLGWLKLAVEEH